MGLHPIISRLYYCLAAALRLGSSRYIRYMNTPENNRFTRVHKGSMTMKPLFAYVYIFRIPQYKPSLKPSHNHPSSSVIREFEIHNLWQNLYVYLWLSVYVRTYRKNYLRKLQLMGLRIRINTRNMHVDWRCQYSISLSQIRSCALH